MDRLCIFSIFESKNPKKKSNFFLKKIFRRQFWFSILKVSFKDFEFVFGAKLIYFFQRIRIHRNFWRARTSARALRVENSGIWAKNHQKCHFRHFCSALSARASADAPIFAALNSPNAGDEFCTLNESKIVKIDN